MKTSAIKAETSRRSFFTHTLKGGVIAATVGALPFGVQKVFADTAGDIAILNFALTLEHLEHAFYREQLARFSPRNLAAYNIVGSLRRNLRRVASRGTLATGSVTTTNVASTVGLTNALELVPGITNVPGITDIAGAATGTTDTVGTVPAFTNVSGIVPPLTNVAGVVPGFTNIVGTLFGSTNTIAGPLDGVGRTAAAAAGGLYELLFEIHDHEAAHVQTLTQTIINLGGVPVPERTYNFGVRNARDFLRLAQTLENLGVSAYGGAVPLIITPALQTAAVAIATVEARHASLLNLVNGDDPFPAALDTPRSIAEVLTAVASFIVT